MIRTSRLTHWRLALGGACAMLLLSTSAYGQTWTPPIGVPTPSFGIREQPRSAPSPWTAEVAGYYYVDNTHSLANDSMTYGTPARPRRSIPAGVAAGSVVEVHGGPYTTTLNLSGGGNGTAASPIFYRGVGKPRIVSTVDHRNFAVYGSYVILDGFEFVNLQVAMVGHHTSIRNSEVRGMTPAPGGSAVYTGNTTDVVIFGNYIHHNGNNNYPVENDIHGVLVGPAAARVWVVDNEMYANGGSSIQINSNADLANLAKLVYIARNRMHEEGETGIAIKSAEDVIISQNEVWGFRPTDYPHSGSDGTAILIDDQNAWNALNNRMWILFNHVHDSTVGIRTQSYAYIIGNVVRNVQNAAFLTWGSHDLLIEHNTAYNVGRGLERFGGLAGNRVVFVNNIVNTRTWDDVKLTGNAVSTSGLANSLFQSPAIINWGGTVFNLSSFSSAYGCAGCREGSPRFTNPAGLDFRLGSGSPAIGSASPSSIYSVYQQLYGVSISFDLAGRARPGADGKWDMGAFESDGGGAAPAAPTNLRIIR